MHVCARARARARRHTRQVSDCGCEVCAAVQLLSPGLQLRNASAGDGVEVGGQKVSRHERRVERR